MVNSNSEQNLSCTLICSASCLLIMPVCLLKPRCGIMCKALGNYAAKHTILH